MSKCLNFNSVEYQTSKMMSGLTDFLYKVYSNNFYLKYGRLPYLDEMPQANSFNYLVDKLKLNKNNAGNINDLMDYLGTNNIEESVIALNDIHRDYESEIIPMNEKYFLNITERPKPILVSLNDKISNDTKNVDHPLGAIHAMVNKLSRLYGINFNLVTTSQLNDSKFNNVPFVENAKGFVLNGEIYLNTDLMTIDTPVHELMHLLLGSLRFKLPDLYFSIVNSMDLILNKESYINLYPNRTNSDLNEEIFVSEYSKYLVGEESIISQLPDNVLYELKYNINRTLDTLLMGNLSVKVLTEYSDLSLSDIAHILGSSSVLNSFQGTIDKEGARLHRILGNTKSKLMRDGELTEICE